MKIKLSKLHLIGVILISTAVIIGCNKDALFTNDNTASVNKNGTTCAISLDYEVEMVTILRPENPNDLGNLSDFDLIEANPKVSRDLVSVCIGENGELDITAIVKQPLNPYNVPHETLPDDSPKVYETRIQNEMTRSFDKQGNLIDETATDITAVANYQEVVNVMKQIENIDETAIETIVENARSNGSLVFEFENGVVGIENNNGQQIIEMLIDTERLLILGISIYDETHLVQKRIMFDIQGDYKKPIINSILLQDFELSPTSNVRVIRETQMDFDNFQYANSFL
jgi:hypothetical protein